MALQMLLTKASEEEQLGQVLATQGLQMPMMPSRAMGAMTDASKRRIDETSSMAGEEFELVSGGVVSSLVEQTTDPTDLASQIAASSGPYMVPMPKAAAVVPVVAPTMPVSSVPMDLHALPYQAGFAPAIGADGAFVNLEAIDAGVPMPPGVKSTYHWGQVKLTMKKFKDKNYTFEDAVRICLSGNYEMKVYLKWIQNTYTTHYMRNGATSQAPDLAGYMKRIQLVIPDEDKYYRREFA